MPVVTDLCDLPGSDQGANGYQTSLSRRKVRPQPEVAKENVRGVLHDSGRIITTRRLPGPAAPGAPRAHELARYLQAVSVRQSQTLTNPPQVQRSDLA
jgi:hypothetical protein